MLKMITLMKKNLKLISENEKYSHYNDPIIKKGLESLLEHYKGQYDECTKVVVDKLFDDCVKLGSTRSMSLDVCSAFSMNFEELKKV